MSLSAFFLKRCFSIKTLRSFSSGTPISFTLSFEPEPETSHPNPKDDLRSRIFRLRLPKRSATVVVDKWVREGNDVTLSELRKIARDLRKSQRYKHALEISEWMKSHQEFELSESDYAMRIDLITKVFGVNAAEEFFEGLPSAAKTSEVYTALLHAYGKAKLIEKAENLFERIKELNSSSALTYNEMMTLYMSVGQLEKVPLVVEELKKRKVSPDLFTYNLWISASAASLDVHGVRKILDEMSHDSNFDKGWGTYIKLAEIYVTVGNLVTSDNSLVETEKKICQRQWITYDFLIILYSGLGNREGINEIWKSLKMTSQKITSRNYMCVLSSHLVLGKLKEAGEVIDEWMQSNVADFDVSISKRLFDAFVKAGLIDEGEAFRGLMLQRSFALSDSLGSVQQAKCLSLVLQIMTWMESQGSFQLRAPDHATRVDLITKVCSLSEAEVYFDTLSASASQKAAAFPLLHSYVKARNVEKAEALMQRLLNSGLAVDPYLFNEMMKLYMATGQFEKVLSVVRHMRLSKIPLNTVSYSLWLNASSEVSGASSVEMVYKEMKNDKRVEMGWSTYATLANIYIKAGVLDKAFTALKIAETKLSVRDRLAYSFIMTIYACLKDKTGILRVWESSKRVPLRITCANYMSVMLSLIKAGDIEAAEGIFREWESQCRNYDVRVSNVLLGAYMRNGWMDKAEAFHLHTLERGACPNYKTWEILMEGWVNQGKMDKAVQAMKKGFSKLKGCTWKPPLKILLAIGGHFEKQGNVADMRSYVKILHDLGLLSLPLYKSALRAHIKAGENPLDIRRMMERDEAELDEETRALIQCANNPGNPGVKMRS